MHFSPREGMNYVSGVYTHRTVRIAHGIKHIHHLAIVYYLINFCQNLYYFCIVLFCWWLLLGALFASFFVVVVAVVVVAILILLYFCCCCFTGIYVHKLSGKRVNFYIYMLFVALTHIQFYDRLFNGIFQYVCSVVGCWMMMIETLRFK